MSSGSLRKVGSFIGTGAAKVIELNFTPSYIRINNLETKLACEKFAESELSGKEGGLKEATDGVKTNLSAAQGITLGDFKFTVGTDSSCNESGKHHSFLAIE